MALLQFDRTGGWYLVYLRPGQSRSGQPAVTNGRRPWLKMYDCEGGYRHHCNSMRQQRSRLLSHWISNDWTLSRSKTLRPALKHISVLKWPGQLKTMVNKILRDPWCTFVVESVCIPFSIGYLLNVGCCKRDADIRAVSGCCACQDKCYRRKRQQSKVYSSGV